ncbi:S41 family peptidase [Eubacteriales bacterium OttesenSCG-928-K08]|nr:S41 family peptidase [Eubacteriales bacterium OttesenSCG-928-K08]
MKPRFRSFLYYAATAVIVACLSVALTVVVINRRQQDRVVLATEEFQRINEAAPLLELMDLVEDKFYGSSITREQMLKGALSGALSVAKDPYARYYTEQEYLDFLQQLDGSYHGIGALIGQPNESGVPVLKVYSKSPAEEAGLLVGDIITSVDGTSVLSITMEEIDVLFTGEDGSIITLEVLRGGDRLSFTAERGAGSQSQVNHKLFLQYTGYIRIDKFTGTAQDEFGEALADLTDRGMRSLVIDLRNNPGGELVQVLAIANRLLSNATIVTVKDAEGEPEVHKADAKSVNVPLAILVNENSASASEILASAIQENGRGIIVGMPTYGKGVVQTTHQLKTNSGWIKMTTAAYYTPGGNNVDGIGVIPDIEIDLADDVKALPVDKIDQNDDAQLWAALDEIRAQADALDEQAG